MKPGIFYFVPLCLENFVPGIFRVEGYPPHENL